MQSPVLKNMYIFYKRREHCSTVSANTEGMLNHIHPHKFVLFCLLKCKNLCSLCGFLPMTPVSHQMKGVVILSMGFHAHFIF